MNFSIYTENGSGCEYFSKDQFLEELSRMIDDAKDNGASYFEVEVSCDASPYYQGD